MRLFTVVTVLTTKLNLDEWSLRLRLRRRRRIILGQDLSSRGERLRDDGGPGRAGWPAQ